MKDDLFQNNTNGNNILFESNPQDIEFFNDLIEESYADHTLEIHFVYLNHLIKFIILYMQMKKIQL